MASTWNSDLLERLKRFDRQTLAELYDQYSPGLYRYAYRLLGDEDTAEDCVAETFSRFLQVLSAGKGPQAFLQAYLYRVAHNWITDFYRRRPMQQVELVEELPSSEPHPEDRVADHLLQGRVRAALLRLTPEQRQVILLKYMEGWENDQVAACMNRPVGAIKALQHRALAALRRLLKEEELYETMG